MPAVAMPPGWDALPLARRVRARALIALQAGLDRSSQASGFVTRLAETLPARRRAATVLDAARRALAPVRAPRTAPASLDPGELPRVPRARRHASAPRVSIVVPTRGAPTLAQCLAAIDAHTDERALEVIAVADGVALEAPPWVRVLRVAARRGFAGAANAGARAARGETLVLLNDDAIVTPGWLVALLAALSLPRAGLAAPATNASGDEATRSASYADLRGLLAHAAAQRGEPRDARKLSLMCAAMDRALFLRLGGLDEGYGLGLFEDDELCAAMRRRRRRVLLAPSAWVHHHESATFGRMPMPERIARFEINRHRFEQRSGARWRA